eukprot:6142146-Pleurochrysis_carterae.AAC.1
MQHPNRPGPRQIRPLKRPPRSQLSLALLVALPRAAELPSPCSDSLRFPSLTSSRRLTAGSAAFTTAETSTPACRLGSTGGAPCCSTFPTCSVTLPSTFFSPATTLCPRLSASRAIMATSRETTELAAPAAGATPPFERTTAPSPFESAFAPPSSATLRSNAAAAPGSQPLLSSVRRKSHGARARS